jgi:tyrosyl-DNA phosphodiesterase-1
MESQTKKRKEIIDLSDDTPNYAASPAPRINIENDRKAKRQRKSAVRWQPFYLNTIQHLSSKENQNCISFSDFFQYEHDNPFTDVLIMNYMVDLDWIVGEAPHLLEKNVLCLHGQNSLAVSGVPPPSDSWIVNKIDLGIERYGTHHTKMLLIFYQNGLRVVISTGNFIPEDWNSLTQGTFIQDFPLKQSSPYSVTYPPDPAVSYPPQIPRYNDFEKSLMEYFQRLTPSSVIAKNKLKTLIARLPNYDYSSAEVILIPSVPGRHSSNQNRWGIGKLHHMLQENDDYLSSASKYASFRLLMQYSSLGSMGKDGKYIDELGTLMMKTNPFSQYSGKEVEKIHKSIDLVWPTVETVRESFLVKLL